MEKQKHYERFTKLMLLLSISVDKEPSIERTELYYKYLEDLKIDDLEKAVNYLIKTEKFPTFPTVGKIRSLIEGERDELIELEANEAWSKACLLAWDHGSDGNKTGDYLLDEAIRIAFGSWKHFGDTNPQYEGPDRRHFINCYKGNVKKGRFGLLNPAEIRKQLTETREKISKIEKENKP